MTASCVARNDAQSVVARGLVAGMLLYNAGVVTLHAGMALGLTGVLLWPAILIHGALALWCAVSLLNKGTN